MPQVVGKRARLRRRQLRIARRILGVTMMGEVEGAEVGGRQHQDRTARPRHGVVQPPAAKRGPVDRFVQRREQEHQDDAVQEHRRRQPERAARRPHQGAGREQGAQMAGQLTEALAIGARS